MKKIIIIVVVLIIAAGLYVSWAFISPATTFKEDKATLYIRTNAATRQAVTDSLEKNGVIKNRTAFEWLAGRMNYWENIKPGMYEIKKGSNLLAIIRQLRNGKQTPVNLVLRKMRLKEDLARLTGGKFEFDSTEMINYLNNNSYLNQEGIDTGTIMFYVLPDTYTYFWNSTPEKVFEKLVQENEKFWNEERIQKAQSKNLTPVQAHIVASIVEEETNADSEKGEVASVYLNRVRIGMPLQADPTVKFALRDFGLKRIYHTHLQASSPYNTYRNKGLPPGPISTPSRKTIDAVLDAPQTNYLYFVASPKLDGTHDFSATYDEHLKKARLYQKELNRLDSVRKSKQS
ncbi:MAG: endolytic transglycosylase MltG [Bacteroidota bacterium]|nr:endolytic transglycosylase MltG [Bacteroidota bacterium]